MNTLRTKSCFQNFRGLGAVGCRKFVPPHYLEASRGERNWCIRAKKDEEIEEIEESRRAEEVRA